MYTSVQLVTLPPSSNCNYINMSAVPPTKPTCRAQLPAPLSSPTPRARLTLALNKRKELEIASPAPSAPSRAHVTPENHAQSPSPVSLCINGGVPSPLG